MAEDDMGLVLIGTVIWFTQASLTGWLATERGRDPVAWMLLGLLSGPIAMIAVGLAPLKAGGIFKSCVECLLAVPALATRCPYCRTDLIRAEGEEDALAAEPG
jgi:hypothetical protein